MLGLGALSSLQATDFFGSAMLAPIYFALCVGMLMI